MCRACLLAKSCPTDNDCTPAVSNLLAPGDPKTQAPDSADPQYSVSSYFPIARFPPIVRSPSPMLVSFSLSCRGRTVLHRYFTTSVHQPFELSLIRVRREWVHCVRFLKWVFPNFTTDIVFPSSENLALTLFLVSTDRPPFLYRKSQCGPPKFSSRTPGWTPLLQGTFPEN